MSRLLRRVLLALYGISAVLAAPWAIDYAIRVARRQPWRQPAVPHFRLDTPRTTTRRSST